MNTQKDELILGLHNFQKALRQLRKTVDSLRTDRVTRKDIRDSADRIVTEWVENLRSPLEYRYKIAESIVQETSNLIKRMHVLSRPNNRKSSYLEVIDALLADFEDKYVAPVKLFASTPKSLASLETILSSIPAGAYSDYMQEAITCAAHGCYRASIVLGWCATVHRLQTKVTSLGFQAFNNASTQMKAATSGKFKKWNKEFSVSTLAELQEVFDSDLLLVLEWMQLLDGNQASRLKSCFDYRNQSAHPGNAPIQEPHIVAFFSDIVTIVLSNNTFA